MDDCSQFLFSVFEERQVQFEETHRQFQVDTVERIAEIGGLVAPLPEEMDKLKYDLTASRREVKVMREELDQMKENMKNMNMEGRFAAGLAEAVFHACHQVLFLVNVSVLLVKFLTPRCTLREFYFKTAHEFVPQANVPLRANSFVPCMSFGVIPQSSHGFWNGTEDPYATGFSAQLPTFEVELNPGVEVDEFMRVSKNRRRVTVVRGLMNNTRASKEFCSKDWVRAHGDFSLVEVLPKKDEYKYDYTYNTVNFSQYIQDIQSGNHRYSNGLDEMLLRYPDLVESMELKRLQSPFGCRAVAIFVNGKGKGLRWHNANHFNMVMEYHGKKIWQLLDGKYSLFTAPGMAMDPYATGFTANSPKSMFDKLPTFEVELNPGDVLFNPVWSWHTVRNEADPNTNLVAMGSCRFSEWDKALTTAPALELGRSWGHPMWVSSKLPPWVMWIPFFRVLQDGIGIAYDLFPMWGQAGYEVDCFSSKTKACDHHYETLGVKWGDNP